MSSTYIDRSWQGYTSADDTWEPWHHLEENTFLHQ
jgi:hypothetical protein